MAHTIINSITTIILSILFEMPSNSPPIFAIATGTVGLVLFDPFECFKKVL